MQLVELAAQYENQQRRQIALIGVTKETGIDDEGIVEFYRDYFNSNTIYKDEKWNLYKAMGGKQLGFVGMIKAQFNGYSRWKRKNITGSKNHGQTDPWMLGGLLIFDKQGYLVNSIDEVTGLEFPIDRIQRAIEGIQKMNESVEELGDDERLSQTTTASKVGSDQDTTTGVTSSEVSSS